MGWEYAFLWWGGAISGGPLVDPETTKKFEAMGAANWELVSVTCQTIINSSFGHIQSNPLGSVQSNGGQYVAFFKRPVA